MIIQNFQISTIKIKTKQKQNIIMIVIIYNHIYKHQVALTYRKTIVRKLKGLIIQHQVYTSPNASAIRSRIALR